MMSGGTAIPGGPSVMGGDCLFSNSVPIFLKSVSSTMAGPTGSQFGAGVPVNIINFGPTPVPSTLTSENARRLESIQIEVFYSPSGLHLARRTLEVRLADANDPLFYWQCSITEEEFQHLRREQNLLVDFHRFAYKLIELLQQCILHAREELPQFAATLSIFNEETSLNNNNNNAAGVSVGRTAILQISECTSLKQIVHLTLRFTTPPEPIFRKYISEIFRRQREELDCLRGGGSAPMGIDLTRQPSMPVMPPFIPPESATSATANPANLLERVRWLEGQNQLLLQQKLGLEKEVSEMRRRFPGLYGNAFPTVESDINKANEIIRRLQDEVKGLRSRARAAETSLRQLERVGRETGSSYDVMRTELQQVRTQLEERGRRLEEVEGERDRLRRELEENQKLVEANEKVIEWLHQQLNEESISKILAAGTSYRYDTTATTSSGGNNILPRLSPETWLGKSKLRDTTTIAGNLSRTATGNNVVNNGNNSSSTSPGIISPSASA